MATTTDLRPRIRRANAMLTLASSIHTAVLEATALQRHDVVDRLLTIRDELTDTAKRDVAALDKLLAADEATPRLAPPAPRKHETLGHGVVAL